MRPSQRAWKKVVPAIAVIFSVVSLAFAQGVATSGPQSELAKALERFNADVAAWNKRCAKTRSEAEEAWCKKELARINAVRAELIAKGALKPK